MAQSRIHLRACRQDTSGDHCPARHKSVAGLCLCFLLSYPGASSLIAHIINHHIDQTSCSSRPPSSCRSTYTHRAGSWLQIATATPSEGASSTLEMSRTQGDQWIDDEEEDTCPLCVEELDQDEARWRPCPCAYIVLDSRRKRPPFHPY